MSLGELADLAEAYVAVGMSHAELTPALLQQLPAAAQRAAAASSSSSNSKDHAVRTAVGTIRVLQPLMMLAQGLQQPQQQKAANRQLQHMLAVVQDLIMQSGSSSSGSSAMSPVTLVQLLELLSQAAVTHPHWQNSPLVRWSCSAVAAAGLDTLSSLQLQAASAALAALQPPSAAAAAGALAAAAVARSEECGPGVMAGVLWACVTMGCYDMLLAEVTVSVVVQAAMVSDDVSVRWGTGWGSAAQPEQQQQQQQDAQRPYLTAAILPPPAAAAPVLCAQQQAQLVWALQKLGRQDLAQQVLEVCLQQA
jgi:hypothetical protein